MTEDEAPRGDGWRVVAMVAALVLGNGVFGYYLGWRHALGPEADARVAEVEGSMIRACWSSAGGCWTPAASRAPRIRRP